MGTVTIPPPTPNRTEVRPASPPIDTAAAMAVKEFSSMMGGMNSLME
jgi:hypothetical protein